jgi:hypothetical protein
MIGIFGLFWAGEGGAKLIIEKAINPNNFVESIEEKTVLIWKIHTFLVK